MLIHMMGNGKPDLLARYIKSELLLGGLAVCYECTELQECTGGHVCCMLEHIKNKIIITLWAQRQKF